MVYEVREGIYPAAANRRKGESRTAAKRETKATKVNPMKPLGRECRNFSQSHQHGGLRTKDLCPRKLAFEQLEDRRLLAAGELDLSFGGDGFANVPGLLALDMV